MTATRSLYPSLHPDLGGVPFPPADAALRWTGERPTEPGWYWIQDPAGLPRIMFVTRIDGGELWAAGWWLERDSRWNGCRWAGPILPPEPPAAIGGGA